MNAPRTKPLHPSPTPDPPTRVGPPRPCAEPIDDAVLLGLPDVESHAPWGPADLARLALITDHPGPGPGGWLG
jgi:hypothetical protein